MFLSNLKPRLSKLVVLVGAAVVLALLSIVYLAYFEYVHDDGYRPELLPVLDSKLKNDIPKVIHQILPVEPSFREMNPTYAFIGWDNMSIGPLIDDYVSESVSNGSVARDLLLRTPYLWRFLIIYRHGGYFSESDSNCKVKIDDWLSGLSSSNYTQIHGMEDGYKQIRNHYVGDRTFASTAKNQVYRIILDSATKHFQELKTVSAKQLQDFRIGVVSDLLSDGLTKDRSLIYSTHIALEHKLFLPVGSFTPNPGSVRNLVEHKIDRLKIGILTLLIGDGYGTEWNARVIKNREAFIAAQKSPTFHYLQRNLTSGVSHPVWQKISDAKILHQKEGFDWLWLLDADAMIMQGNISLHQMIKHIQEARDEDTDVIIARDCTMLNAGSFFLRLSSPWAEEFISYYASIDNHKEKIKVSDYHWDVFKEQACLNAMYEDNILQVREHTALVSIDYFNSYIYDDGYCDGKQWKDQTLKTFADLVVHSPGCKPSPDCISNFLNDRNIAEF